MEWSIQEVAKLAGTTSRTLRHYGSIGLLPPSSTGPSGYRRYDAASLVRLQRILLLRELGLGLTRISEVLAAEMPEDRALEAHLDWLRAEKERLGRQIAAVESTIETLRGGEQLMAEKMFDGFDHTSYEAEVTERWGADAYARGDAWWRGLDAGEKESWKAETAQLAAEWVRVAESEASPVSEETQRIAARHVAWLTGIPGTPAADPSGDVGGYVRGLADMYVADPRFGRHYATKDGGEVGARFVRDALHAYADAHL